MLKKAFCITIALAVGVLAAGCGNTAGDFAQSYGTINGLGWNKAVAEKIASGEADTLIQSGQAPTRQFVRGTGDSRVLVTEHLIDGVVYRVDVRRAVDPTASVSWTDLGFADASQGVNRRKIEWGALLSIWTTLKNNSYEAKPDVAYRAWKDADGVVHEMRAGAGLEPTWVPDDMATTLVIATSGWHLPSMWFAGLTSGDSNTHKLDRYNSNGQWILMSTGPGAEGVPTSVDGQTYFVNYDLYNTVWGLNW